MDNVLLLMGIILYLYMLINFALYAIHMMQQNRYEIRRFRMWQKQNVTKTYPLAILVSFFFIEVFSLIFTGEKFRYFIVIAVFIILLLNMLNKAHNKVVIKPLVYTNRVKRQLFTYYILVTIFLVILFFLYKVNYILSLTILMLFYLYQMHVISLVCLINYPLELFFRNRYMNKAKTKLDSYVNVSKIGITGSYGKTSSKNIINEILSRKYYCLITPASYNTPQGISITINNSLQAIHEIFICEMGADKVGEISELMNFVQPEIGVVTSIGQQHLSTFKSQENIINEKMQMVELLPSDKGLAVLNRDEKYIREYHIKNNVKTIWYGINEEADIQAKNIVYSKDGSSFDVLINNELVHFETKLLGVHNIYNILAGIAIALHYKISISDLVIAIRQLNYVANRLEVKKEKDYTIIDNAFNSNPISSKLSLDVLEMMPGLRICITPGLIDLGSQQDYYNRELGKYFINKCDRVILVGRKQTKAIYEGLEQSGYNMKYVYVVNKIYDAFNILYRIKEKDSYVLLENDLPDAFNI